MWTDESVIVKYMRCSSDCVRDAIPWPVRALCLHSMLRKKRRKGGREGRKGGREGRKGGREGGERGGRGMRRNILKQYSIS